MSESQQIVDQTKKWINEVIVGLNFCPFAANVIKRQTVYFQVEYSTGFNGCLASFLHELLRLDNEPAIETSFLVFPNSFQQFEEYLKMVSLAERLLKKNGYDGVYQVASFHPLYQFVNSSENDAANYTNRSIYPMLHLLREESIDRALEHYKFPEKIPDRNVNFAREKGIAYMKLLRDTCF